MRRGPVGACSGEVDTGSPKRTCANYDREHRRMPQLSSPDQTTRADLVRLLALLWLGGVAARLPILAIPPVIPLIHDDLHLSETEVGCH